jgi:putative transposase
MRLFPTKEEQEEIKLMMEQFRWYYNSTLNIVYNHYGWKEISKNKLFSSKTRDLIRKYEFIEEKHDNLIFQSFKFDENRNKDPIAPWWSSKPHSRISRGAIDKFCSSLNSAISNYKNKNNNGFIMKYRTKKSPTDYLHFEDKSFPSILKKIKSRYWYTTKDRKRKCLSFSEIQCNNKGIEIIHDKIRNRYFLHYPIEIDWYPNDDRRNDSQVGSVSKRNQIISLDPGIRKFMVGYDPEGNCIFVGEGANKEIIGKLKQIDDLNSFIELEDDLVVRDRMKIDKHILWLKIKNMVDEMHWKTIKYITDNYDTILLPDFKISQMIKSKKIGKSTKRMMCMYSFHRFKEKLKYKCNNKGINLIIVDESYTSKTCGCCGYINDTQGKESLKCINCHNEIDRDASGARNIFIKNTILR